MTEKEVTRMRLTGGAKQRLEELDAREARQKQALADTQTLIRWLETEPNANEMAVLFNRIFC